MPARRKVVRKGPTPSIDGEGVVQPKRALPANRELDQLRNHYLVERSIARKLMAANREERKTLYATMYDELFTKVPDHPRLNRRDSDALTSSVNRDKLGLVKPFLNPSTVFLEYAPGDCRFVTNIATQVNYAYGLDISDQRRPGEAAPDNFELIVYDGYSLDEIESGSIDVIFSDQLIEHFHPEDTRLHFELVHKLLKTGGRYVFRTPHAATGPHDISKYFADVPEGFHLKEWTHGEVHQLVKEVGFSKFRPLWYRRQIALPLPSFYFTSMERLLGSLPKRHAFIRRLADYLLSQVCGVAIK